MDTLPETGRDMDVIRMLDKVRVLHLTEGPAKTYRLETQYTAWANVQTAERKNLFSSVGIGARGVTLTMWKNGRFDLFHALQLHDGTYCFPTSIVPCDDGLHVTVQAAVVTYHTATATLQTVKSRDAKNRPVIASGGTIIFPCVLTEVYRKNDADEISRTITRQVVAVAPKPVELTPGDLVNCGSAGSFVVRTVYTLDVYKNEYLLESEADV